MAERDDRMAQNARNAQSGQNQGGQNASGSDDQAALDKSLQRGTEDLAGDLETNRNLSGSTTYETLREQGDLDVREVDGGGSGDKQSGGNRPGSSGNQSGGGSGGMR